MLAEFEIRLMDKHNRIMTTHIVIGGDAFSTLNGANPYCEAHKIEVWRGRRCVATLQKGVLPLGIVSNGTW